MATPKRLNFSSLGGGGSDDTSPSSSPSRRKSLRKPAPKLTAAEEETKKKKKKKKLASPVTNTRIWNEDDELALVKGLADYRAKTKHQSNIDWDAFLNFVGGSINAKVSKDQLLSKIGKLKRKFRANMERIKQRNDPLFTRSTDSEAFGFCMMIWGETEPEFANAQSKNGEDENVANAEPLTGNGPVESDFHGKSPHEVVATENGNPGKESHGDDNDDDVADELCIVQDAFETLIWQGLSDYQKKLQLEKLMNLGAGKRKELSHEWKELCAEQRKLIIKKLSFFTKLTEAANR